MNQQDKAVEFRRLHTEARPLVLPNAWDAASARIFEDAGFRAIGTTSAGVAASLGYADGQHISREEMLEAVRRIASAVAVPVSADIEAGYGDRAEDIFKTIHGVIASGAVGINLEDSCSNGANTLVEVSLQVEKIRAARDTSSQFGLDFFINARVDVYLMAVGEAASRFDHTLARARAYCEAGADCIFVPGLSDSEKIAALVHEIDAPVNILANPGVPSVLELTHLGVARVSVGSGPMRATLALVRRIARELLEQGTYTSFTEATVSYADTNSLFI